MAKTLQFYLKITASAVWSTASHCDENKMWQKIYCLLHINFPEVLELDSILLPSHASPFRGKETRWPSFTETAPIKQICCLKPVSPIRCTTKSINKHFLWSLCSLISSLWWSRLVNILLKCAPSCVQVMLKRKSQLKENSTDFMNQDWLAHWMEPLSIEIAQVI